MNSKKVLAAVTAATCVGATLGVVSISTASAAPTSAPFLAPYYTALDLTGDRQVTTADLDEVAARLGATSTDPDWSEVAVADVDGNLTLTVSDLAAVSQRMIYNDGPFELVEADVVDMQAAMNAGVTTSVEITQEYIDRIDAYDRTLVDTATGGRPLNAVITTSSTALDAAAAADATRAADGMTSMLLGVPFTVKDNYDTYDMPTTAGCGCWDDNQTTTDATMIAGLRESGAIILSKASMDQFAFSNVSQFSSYQPAGTSLFPASPYNTSQTAGGSSSGTGAGVAANLAAIGLGTDTGTSIRNPSALNELVGLRPTVGLTSREGIVPLALSQDVGGPLARSVLDVAVAMDALVGIDPADPATSTQAGNVPESYTLALNEDSLEGARIGYVASMIGTNPTVVRLFEESKARMEAQGATVIAVDAPTGFNAILAEPSGSTIEFEHDLDIYIANHLDPDVEARSLDAILASGRGVPDRQAAISLRNDVTPAAYDAWLGTNGTHTKAIADGKTVVTNLLDDFDLDALVYPGNAPYGSVGTTQRLSPITNLPALTVPMGQATAADATITGANVNLEFIGREYAESELLGLGYAFESVTQARSAPALYGPLG